MAKKTFKGSTSHLDRFFSDSGETEPQEPHEAQTTQRPQRTHETQTPPAPRYYRLNLKLKAEYREYLERVSWENHQSITQYLNDLIEADKTTKGSV